MVESWSKLQVQRLQQQLEAERRWRKEAEEVLEGVGYIVANALPNGAAQKAIERLLADQPQGRE